MNALLRRPASLPALFAGPDDDASVPCAASRTLRGRRKPAPPVLGLPGRRALSLRASPWFAALAGSMTLVIEYPWLKAAATLLDGTIPH